MFLHAFITEKRFKVKSITETNSGPINIGKFAKNDGLCTNSFKMRNRNKIIKSEEIIKNKAIKLLIFCM
jgi:hypothetical protein